MNTANKIFLAKVACRILMLVRRLLGRSSESDVNRGGIHWHLDIREGIDLSIYLLGGFEPSTLKLYRQFIRAGDTVLDIGANIGAHTLPLARLVGDEGRIVAFEPTRFAMQKLQANVALNPDLSARIVLRQTMLVAAADEPVSPSLFSSWPLFVDSNVHEKHKGRLMETTGAITATLDMAVAALDLCKVDFIKLDVDGHEFTVLAGGLQTLQRCKPLILMELAPYLYRDHPGDFEAILDMFRELGYSFHDASNGKILPMNRLRLESIIPDGSSRNAICLPSDFGKGVHLC